MLRAARERGAPAYVVALEGDARAEVEELAQACVWLKLGAFNKAVRFFRSHGVTDVAMAGGVTKSRLFSRFRPDMRALKIMARMLSMNDDYLLRTVAREFAKDGITIQPSTIFTPELLAPAGALTKNQPSPGQLADIRFGWPLAKAVGRLDIGQCIVVLNRSVVAVEAVEGTDETIRRAGRITKGGAVVIKVSKPGQDMRFDIPSVGPRTIASMAQAGAAALAIEAGRTLVFNLDETVSAAQEAGIAIIALEKEPKP